MRVERGAGLPIGVLTLIAVLLTPTATFRVSTRTGHFPLAWAQPISDTRERVRLTTLEKDRLLLEMRTMLQSLSGIMQGLVANDLVKAEKAARMSEMGPAVDPGFDKNLPPEFLQLIARTRRRFGGLAEAIKARASRDVVLRRLAAVTATCVTCHETYRLGETRE
jgi:hypothetical protein